MPIDRKTRNAERVAEDDVRGLAADAGQRYQRRHRVRDFAGVLFDDGGGHADEGARLGAKEACGLNLRLELTRRRASQRARIGVTLE